MGFRLATIADRAVLVDGDGWHDLAAASDGAFTGDPMEAVRRYAAIHAVAEAVGDRSPDGLVADATFGPPVPAPRSVFAVGLNYADHVGEAQMEVPENPLIFTKFPSCLVGPTDDVVLNTTAGDYEAELVVVIGEGGRDIAADDAWGHVMGCMVGQDISDRALQFAAKPPQFGLAKSFDSYGPIGPELVSIAALEAQGVDRNAIGLRCEINGEERQNSSSDDLIFSVPDLVAALSHVATLEPGVTTGHLDKVADDYIRSQGVEIYTPDLEAFRIHVQAQYVGSEAAASWPEGVLDKINALGGGTAMGFKTDLEDETATREFAKQAIEELNGVDLLIHNASGFENSQRLGHLIHGIEVACVGTAIDQHRIDDMAADIASDR